MTLKTSLIISGDSREAQRAVEDLRRDVDGLDTSATRADGTLRDLAAGQGAVASSARGAIGAITELGTGQRAVAGSARDVTDAHGALAPAIDNTSIGAVGLSGTLTQMNVAQLLVQQGSDLLASTLAGALAGGIAGVVTGAISLVVQLGAEAFAAAQANSASAALAQSLVDLDAAQKSASKSARQLANDHYAAAQAKLKDLVATRELIKANITAAQSEAAKNLAAGASNGTRGGDLALQRAYSAKTAADRLAVDLGNQDAAIANARKTVAETALPVLKNLTKAGLDPATSATNRYEDSVARLDARWKAGKITVGTYRAEYGRLSEQHEAATAAAGRATGAIGRTTVAHQAGATAARAHAVGTGAVAAAERDLASDLASIIGRFDPAAKAASDYADEIARIARLEAAGAGKGGIAPEAAARYRDAATAARDLATVEAQRAQLKLSNPEYFGAIVGLEDFSSAAKAHEQVADAAREAADAERQLKDAARGALDAIIVGGETASHVINNLAKSLASAAIEAGVFGTGPLAGLLKGGITASGDQAAAKGVIGGASSDVIGKSVSKGMESGLDRIFGKGKGATALKQAGYGAAAAGVTGGNSALGALGGAAGGAIAGKLLSSALGSFAGPLGSVVGGVLVGALGGLLKKTKTGSATFSDSSSDATLGGNSASYQKAAAGLAGNVQDIVANIAKQLGGTAGSFGAITIGQRHDDYRVNLGGTSLKVAGGAKDFNGDEQGAVLYAAQAALARGAVTGLSAAVAKALQSSGDIQKGLDEALKVQDLELLLGGIGGQIDKAFRDYEVTAKERVRIAKQYGFDVVAIEKRNAEDRVKLASDLAKAQVGSLQSLVDELTRGSLFEGSAIDRIAAINQGITKAQADLDAGIEGAGDTLAKLLQDRVAASKDAYGTTGNYATDRNATLDQARAAIARANAQIAASQAKTDPALAITNAALNENNDQNAQIVSGLGDIRSILSGIAATGGGGDGGGRRLNLYDVARF